jgi:hypothetical protein
MGEKEPSPIDGQIHSSVWGCINDLTARMKKQEDELWTVRHFVYCHCSHSGAYQEDICGKCELVKFCWPPRDYGKDFPEPSPVQEQAGCGAENFPHGY